MIGFTVDKAKGAFFDSESVTKALDKAERDNLSRHGANIRREAQTSIQIRPGAASEGQPPHGHVSGTRTRTSKSTGRTRTRGVSLLREFIYFVFEAISRSVIIGPAKLNGVIGNAPEALEKGGPSQRLIGPPDKQEVETIQIRPHPYMQPALEEECKRLDPIWRDSVRP